MKKMSHQVELVVNANPKAVWKIIGSGENVDKWLPVITSCRVEGNKRYCGTAEGSFDEDILESNNETMTFRYLIPQQHMMPVENIEGTMQVTPINNESANVRWHWKFDIDENNFEAVTAGLSQLGEMGIKGIEALAQKNQLQQI